MVDTRKQIERIQYMTKLYEDIREVVEADAQNAAWTEELHKKVSELEAYYEGADSKWLEDVDADSRGEIPKEMNREILTEDAIYDLLTSIYAIYDRQLY